MIKENMNQKELYEQAQMRAVLRKEEIRKFTDVDLEKISHVNLPAPIISLKGLHSDFERISQICQLCDLETLSLNGPKQLVKRLIGKMIRWYLRPILERQSEFNLRTVRILESTIQYLEYMQKNNNYGKINETFEKKEPKKGIILTCPDNINKESKQNEILLMFHYFNRFINSDSHLIVMSDKVESNNYLQCLFREVNELEIRNVHFIINPDEIAKKDYYKMTSAFISLSNDLNFWEVPDNAVLFTKASNVFNRKNIYQVQTNSIEEVAELIATVIQN